MKSCSKSEGCVAFSSAETQLSSTGPCPTAASLSSTGDSTTRSLSRTRARLPAARKQAAHVQSSSGTPGRPKHDAWAQQPHVSNRRHSSSSSSLSPARGEQGQAQVRQSFHVGFLARRTRRTRLTDVAHNAVNVFQVFCGDDAVPHVTLVYVRHGVCARCGHDARESAFAQRTAILSR